MPHFPKDLGAKRGLKCGRVPALDAGVEALPMLDNTIHNYADNAKPFDLLLPSDKALKRKKGRLYHCLISGMKWHQNEDMYFLTLTSKVKGGLMRDWNMLVHHIRRTYGKFEFCCVETSEGNGVLHIVFTGSRLDINDIRVYWKKLRDAPQMVIKWVKRGDIEKLQVYMLAQYVAGQDAYVRHTSSSGWVYPGYRDDFMFLIKKLGFARAVMVWDETMETRHAVGQVRFDGSWIAVPADLKVFRKQTAIWNKERDRKHITGRPVRGLPGIKHPARRKVGSLYHLPYIEAVGMRCHAKKKVRCPSERKAQKTNSR